MPARQPCSLSARCTAFSARPRRRCRPQKRRADRPPCMAACCLFRTNRAFLPRPRGLGAGSLSVSARHFSVGPAGLIVPGGSECSRKRHYRVTDAPWRCPGSCHRHHRASCGCSAASRCSRAAGTRRGRASTRSAPADGRHPAQNGFAPKNGACIRRHK